MKKAREKPKQRTGSPKPAAAPPGGSPLGAKGDGDPAMYSNNSPRFRRIRILNKSNLELYRLRVYWKADPGQFDRVVNLASPIPIGSNAHGHANPPHRSTSEVEVRIWTAAQQGVKVQFSVDPSDGCIEDLFVVVLSYRPGTPNVVEALEVEALASYAVADDATTVDKPFPATYHDVTSLLNSP